MPVAVNTNEVIVYGGSTVTVQQLFADPANAAVGDVGVYMRRQVDVLNPGVGPVRYIYTIPARTLTINGSRFEVINAHLVMSRDRSTTKVQAIDLFNGAEFVLGQRTAFGTGASLENYDPRSMLTITDQGAPWEGAGGHGIYCSNSTLRLNGVFNPSGFYGFLAQNSTLELNCAVFGYGRESLNQQQFIADSACTISGDYFYLKALSGFASPRLLSWASLPDNTVLQDCKIFECSNTNSYYERFGWNHPQFECIHGSLNFANIYTATFKNPVRKYDKFNFRNYANQNYGEAVISLDVSLKAQSTSYDPVPAAIYARDRNSGLRKGPHTADKIYTAQASAGGSAVLTDVLASYWLMTSAEYQANPNLQVPLDVRLPLDVWAYDYGYNILSTFVDQRDGTPEIDATLTLVPDQSVSLSKVAAAALTKAASLDDLYDLAKLWKTQPIQSRMEYPSLTKLLVTASGSELDLGALNLVVDKTAATAFAVNTSTNTITIKSDNLAAGAKGASLKTTGTITAVNGATIAAPYVDASGVKSSITNLDPQGFGTTWVLGWISTANYSGRTPNTPPNAWTGWSQSSGTGNSTRVTLAPATEYQLFLRIPGYFAPIGPIATIDTTTQTSVSLPVIVDTDLVGNALWPQTAAHTTQAAKFVYDYGDQVVEYNNQTGATEYITFLAAYRALELIAKSPSMAYQLIQPMYLNGTRDGFTLPRTNPLKARMSDASTGGAILQADIAYGDNQAKAFDRFLANTQNAGGHLLIPQATAGISANTVADIRSGLALEASVQSRPTLAQIEGSILLAKADQVQAVADAVTAIGTPLQADDYVAPANADIASIKTTVEAIEPTDISGLATQFSVDALGSNVVTLGNMVTALGTPLQASAYTEPPAAATVAGAVRTELATELVRLDAAVSTRLAASNYTEPDNAGIAAIQTKVNTLQNPDLSGLATHADALDISNQIGQPLQAGDYTMAPTASANATAVRNALATELARIDATISSRSTLTMQDIPEGLTAVEVWATPTRTLTEPPGLTSGQAEQLRKVAQLHGVGAELVVTETARTAGDVSQTITTDENGNTTVSAA